MNIVILAGGTGSIALQTGLYRMFDTRFGGVDTKVIVNAYDNGLSTGAVRRVLGGRILGPSDVRKNQTTRLKLENPNSPWIKFLNIRFTVESDRAKEYCLAAVGELKQALGATADPLHIKLLEEAIGVFFATPVAEKIDYNDFSLANIVYAGFARAHNNSLHQAATIMSMLMGIKGNVLVNDDTSLFLGAVTKNGIRVTDEGDIVAWGKTDDPFVDIFFTDAEGNDAMPVLCDEARDALLAADLIIMSSGTQWSSLIPTYASKGFAQTISHCSAKIIMVMNRQPDKDSPGQTASDIVDLLVPKYFPKGRVHLLLDSTGHKQMSSVSKEAEALLASVNTFPMGSLSELSPTKHSPDKLVRSIGRVFFREHLDSQHYMFDYDDTLVGRGNHQADASKMNKQMICMLKNAVPVSICTGNSIRAVAIDTETNLTGWEAIDYHYKPLTVYADGGINMYDYDTRQREDDQLDEGGRATFVKCVNPTAAIKTAGAHGVPNIIATLKDKGIPLSKIENRGNVVISIKPIDAEYRPAILSLVRILLDGTGLQANAAGRTTIDIMHREVSKADAVDHILSNGVTSVTFVGDEFARGNDAPVAAMNDARVKCLHIKDPAMTAFFLTTLMEVKGNHNG